MRTGIILTRLLIPISLLLISTGCSWVNSFLVGTDNTLPPSELQPIDTAVSLQQLWSKNITTGDGGTFIELRPAYEQGRLFAAGYKGDVVALDSSTGQVAWSTDTDLPVSAGVGLGDNLVLIGTIDGDVVALRQSDGAEAWRARVSSEILAPPQAAQGVVVVRTIDGNFTALDAASGSRLWGYSYSVPALSLRGTSAPLIARGVVLTGLDTGKLLVLQLNSGVPVWEKVIAPSRGRTELDRMVDIDAEPRLMDNELYIVTYQGSVTAINLNGGDTLWSRNFSSRSGLDVDSGQVYVSDDEGSVWALDRRNGGSLWRQTDLTGRKLSAPVVNGDYVVVGDFEGYLHWLDKSSGRIVGRLRVDSDGIGVAPLARDNTLYVLGNGGELSAIRALPPG
jgi:outer membrane protein assembly factor BamB